MFILIGKQPSIKWPLKNKKYYPIYVSLLCIILILYIIYMFIIVVYMMIGLGWLVIVFLLYRIVTNIYESGLVAQQQLHGWALVSQIAN